MGARCMPGTVTPKVLRWPLSIVSITVHEYSSTSYASVMAFTFLLFNAICVRARESKCAQVTCEASVRMAAHVLCVIRGGEGEEVDERAEAEVRDPRVEHPRVVPAAADEVPARRDRRTVRVAVKVESLEAGLGRLDQSDDAVVPPAAEAACGSLRRAES